MSEPGRFAGQVALVTGAGRGIGAATARLFAAEGARVALMSRTAAELEALAGELGEDRALAVPGDVSREPDVQGVVAAVRARWGEIDHLVNNAGALGKRPLLEMDVGTWDEVMAVNLRGPFLLTRAFLAGRDPGRGGTVVNVASIAGVLGPDKFPGFCAYGASKAGLLLFTEVAATEARDLGVRVVAVSPGSTDTAMLAEAAPGLAATLQPEQIASVIAWACSAEAAALTGANVNAWG